ncbi:uncharacterized protein LOC128249931 isoform X2 [Octopus bimaculoides]|uniref:uncharacterized protein LOC128249931 isoform X2 n=1 Tax=Octopus bimaculoides TaxID=37653 RepID=UPI0022E2143E|nr:uncharacterized protein LOC128249931 isoform X2 [Octopus bimaculoides]
MLYVTYSHIHDQTWNMRGDKTLIAFFIYILLLIFGVVTGGWDTACEGVAETVCPKEFDAYKRKSGNCNGYKSFLECFYYYVTPYCYRVFEGHHRCVNLGKPSSVKPFA